jgi:hypothetical protein
MTIMHKQTKDGQYAYKENKISPGSKYLVLQKIQEEHQFQTIPLNKQNT